MKYIMHNGMEKTELGDCDSVELIMDNGAKFELQYRRSDGEVSLSCSNRLVIVPVASNVVRLEVRK